LWQTGNRRRAVVGPLGRVTWAGSVMQLGVLLRDRRRRLGLTQEEVAERSGVSVRAIRAIESGRVTSSRRRTVELLAAVVGIDVADVFAVARDEQPPPAPAASSGGWLGRVGVPPAQMPLAVTGFTGRDAELSRLDLLLAATEGPSIAVLSGPAGVGKTALALCWAHRVRDQFPHGQLYVHLRGFENREPAKAPIEALSQLLRALGISSDRVPDQVDEAAALYRSCLADRQVLVVLDDAASAGQVRPLLPSSRASVVLVTSRHQLTGLMATDGAQLIALDTLSHREALTLLSSVVGEDRIAAERGAAEQLARQCDHLPLALRIAAAHLVSGHHPRLSALVADLAEDPLATLVVEGDDSRAVRAAFELSYQALSQRDQVVFRRLGLPAGQDVTPDAVAALCNSRPALATHALRRLTASHLIEEYRPGRYRLHGLLKRYAAERARIEDDRSDLVAALGRFYKHYVQRAAAARQVIFPHAVGRLVTIDDPKAVFGDTPQAKAWLEQERPNIVSAVGSAEDGELAVLACELADTMRDYFHFNRHTHDWQQVADAALSLATRHGDPRLEAAAHLMCVQLHRRLGRFERAVEHGRLALDLSTNAGWNDGRQAATGIIGGVCLEHGRMLEAVDAYSTGLEVDDDAGRALNLIGLGSGCWGLGLLDKAIANGEEAVVMMRRLGSATGEGIALVYLGEACTTSGQLDRALEALTAGARICSESGIVAVYADAQLFLATAHCQAGRVEPALRHARTALTIARDVGHRRAEADTLNVLGAIHELAGNLTEALTHRTKALAMSIDGDLRYSVVVTRIGLGSTLLRLGDIERAAREVERALADAARYGYGELERQATELRHALATAAHPQHS
jgi:tetratricopeptide (TPR) repeat protein/transcriptional regulator with XRE-family HTH domain